MSNNTSIQGKVIQNKSIVTRINLCLPYLIIIWYTMPLLQYKFGMLGIYVLYFFWFATTRLNISIKLLRNMKFYWIWLIYTVVAFLLGVSFYASPIYFLSASILLILPGIIYLYYIELDRHLYLKKLAYFSIIPCVITCALTLSVLSIYPDASRVLATASEEKSIYMSMGTGGYGFVFGLTFMITAIAKAITTKKHIWKKAFLIVCLIYMFFLIIKASYTMSIILTTLGIVLVLINKNKKTIILCAFITLLLCIFVNGNILSSAITNFAGLFSNDSLVQLKLLDTADYFADSNSSIYASGRIELYETSLKSFIAYPLFGDLFFGNATFGGHSSWLDTLAKYGLCGGIILFLSFKNLFSDMVNKTKIVGIKNNEKMIFIVTLMFIVFGLVDPILYLFELGIFIFLIAPSFNIIDNNIFQIRLR